MGIIKYIYNLIKKQWTSSLYVFFLGLVFFCMQSYLVHASATPNQVLTDSFDSLTLGALDGQNGWTADSATVTDNISYCVSGAGQCVTFPVGDSQVMTHTFSPRATGTLEANINTFIFNGQNAYEKMSLDDKCIIRIANNDQTTTFSVNGYGSYTPTGTRYKIIYDGTDCHFYQNETGITSRTAYSTGTIDLLTIGHNSEENSTSSKTIQSTIDNIGIGAIPVITLDEPVNDFSYAYTPIQVIGSVDNAESMRITYNPTPGASSGNVYLFGASPSTTSYDFNFWTTFPEGTIQLTVMATGGGQTVYEYITFDVPEYNPFEDFEMATSTGSMLNFDEVRTFCADTFPEASWTEDIIRSICELGGFFVIPTTESLTKFNTLDDFINTKFPFTYLAQISGYVDTMVTSSTATSSMAVLSLPIPTSTTTTSSVPILSYSIVTTYPWITTIRTWIAFAFWIATSVLIFRGVAKLL